MMSIKAFKVFFSITILEAYAALALLTRSWTIALMELTYMSSTIPHEKVTHGRFPSNLASSNSISIVSHKVTALCG